MFYSLPYRVYMKKKKKTAATRAAHMISNLVTNQCFYAFNFEHLCTLQSKPQICLRFSGLFKQECFDHSVRNILAAYCEVHTGQANGELEVSSACSSSALVKLIGYQGGKLISFMFLHYCVCACVCGGVYLFVDRKMDGQIGRQKELISNFCCLFLPTIFHQHILDSVT